MLEELPDLEAFDLLDSMRMPQLRSQLMETLSDRFMRQIAFALFQRMRHSVQLLSCINGVMSHESALSQLPEVMLAGIAELTPLRGRMLVAIDGDLIGAVVDALCGAQTARSYERYELSAMETRIGKQVIDLTFSMISETMAGLMQLDLVPIGYENASGMLAIADGQDWMIACTGIFDTALGTGTIKIVAPYAGFEPLEAKIAGGAGMLGGRGDDAAWIATIETMTEDTPIGLRFEIARSAVPLAIVEALAAGDLLPVPLLGEAIACAGRLDLFRADYGQSDGYICCRAKTPRGEGETMADQKEQAGRSDTGARADRTEARTDSERVELERLRAEPRGGAVITARGLLDRVQVMVTVELGRCHVSVKDLRALRHGQIVTLDQMVGEPLTIFANGQRLATGEVVAVPNDHYGIRVTALADETIATDEDDA
jgi:flagellar motor switch protein FliM